MKPQQLYNSNKWYKDRIAELTKVKEELEEKINKQTQMYTISKEFHFSASHILFGLDDGHPCGRLHGHNYVIVVELQAETLNDVGFVKDYRELDSIKKFIDEELDHKHLNDLKIPDGLSYGDTTPSALFPGNPSAETMARVLFLLFRNMVPYIHSVTVKETPKTAATFRIAQVR